MTTRKSKRANPVLADATAATNNNVKVTKDEDKNTVATNNHVKITKDEGDNNGSNNVSQNQNVSKENDTKKVEAINENTDSPIHPDDNDGSDYKHINGVPIKNQQTDKNTSIKPSSVEELSK